MNLQWKHYRRGRGDTMQLIFEGVDITKDVEINKAEITDTAGCQADSLEIRFSDTQKLWSKWKPEKNHRIEIKEGGFSSGQMFVDSWAQIPGFFILRALSVQQEAKTPFYKAWEEVRFLEIVNEIAGKYGFQVQTYGIENHNYKRLNQFNKTDIEFLSDLCKLEGYSLKITNMALVIFNEVYIEQQAPVKTIYLEDFDGDFYFEDGLAGAYSACQIIYGDIKAETRDNTIKGPVKKVTDLFVSSIAEAQRFSAGILRNLNKNHAWGTCKIRFDQGLAAGNMVELSGLGLSDGKYFCETVIHELVSEKTKLRLRRPLEGY